MTALPPLSHPYTGVFPKHVLHLFRIRIGFNFDPSSNITSQWISRSKPLFVRIEENKFCDRKFWIFCVKNDFCLFLKLNWRSLIFKKVSSPLVRETQIFQRSNMLILLFNFCFGSLGSLLGSGSAFPIQIQLSFINTDLCASGSKTQKICIHNVLDPHWG